MPLPVFAEHLLSWRHQQHALTGREVGQSHPQRFGMLAAEVNGMSAS